MEQKLRYHLIEPGTPEFKIANDLHNAVQEFNRKVEVLKEHFNQEMATLNNHYLPLTEKLRKQLYPFYTDKNPSDIERDGGLMLATQFLDDLGFFMMVEVEQNDTLTGMEQLINFTPEGGKAN